MVVVVGGGAVVAVQSPPERWVDLRGPVVVGGRVGAVVERGGGEEFHAVVAKEGGQGGADAEEVDGLGGGGGVRHGRPRYRRWVPGVPGSAGSAPIACRPWRSSIRLTTTPTDCRGRWCLGATTSAWSPTCRRPPSPVTRSEEHTSELQSLMRISYAVFCLKKQ